MIAQIDDRFQAISKLRTNLYFWLPKHWLKLLIVQVQDAIVQAADPFYEKYEDDVTKSISVVIVDL